MTLMMTAIRRGGPEDLEAVSQIQSRSPEAAQWQPVDYLAHDFRVAMAGEAVAGFVVSRRIADDEHEILNLAVAPEFRRKGIARDLLQSAIQNSGDSFYLEVRESNQGARLFYKSLGFQEISVRPRYYEKPCETAIVMKFHSC
jgi:ribosomal-protein-alanine N-acetyltransferase